MVGGVADIAYQRAELEGLSGMAKLLAPSYPFWEHFCHCDSRSKSWPHIILVWAVA